QACIAFLCDCGMEFFGKSHTWCPISNFTLVRKEAGAVNLKSHANTANPSQAILKCPLCPNYYNSITSMYHHLKNGHNTTPKEVGIAFRCDCGAELYSHVHKVNGKECEKSTFTIVNKKKERDAAPAPAAAT
ncbi:hypothetical protein PFISCL1PPCAC_25997, partial [Pristionchus fissidentatus]